METKTFLKGLFILLILILGIGYYSIVKNSPPSTDDLILKEIQNLELKLDSLSDKKDSIRTIILTTDKEILNNEKHYEEVVNTIIIQPDSITDAFIGQYIRDYAASRGYNIR